MILYFEIKGYRGTMGNRKRGVKSVIATGLKYVFSMALLGAVVLLVIAAYISV